MLTFRIKINTHNAAQRGDYDAADIDKHGMEIG